MHLNVEIKAKCKNPNTIHEVLKKLGADYRGLDHQIDTYFNVTNGRLKLRQGTIENNLIHYQRANQSGPKDSKVTLYTSNEASSESLKNTLSASLGILVVVDKRRHIYFIDNVKFHIDEVKNLGSFVEIEAIDKDGSMGKAKLLAQCTHFMHQLNVTNQDLIDCSYSDLILAPKISKNNA